MKTSKQQFKELHRHVMQNGLHTMSEEQQEEYWILHDIWYAAND